MSTSHDWETGETSGFVDVNGYKLWIHASGPKRQTPNTPAVIIVHGLSACWKEWTHVLAKVSQFARVYIYSRSGYHPSDRAPRPSSLPNIAAELKAMLEAAKISPPYLLVGHSYGGQIIRQYLADFGPSTIGGMVIKDSAPERTYVPEDWPTVLGSAKYEDVVIRPVKCFSDEEFDDLLKTSEKNEGPGSIAEEEESLHAEASRMLRERLCGKRALGDAPLSVMYCHTEDDFRKMYEYGEKHQNGTAETREAFRKALETFHITEMAGHNELLDLSSNSRLADAEGKARTHNSQAVEPDFVAGEIEWVYRQCIKSA